MGYWVVCPPGCVKMDVSPTFPNVSFSDSLVILAFEEILGLFLCMIMKNLLDTSVSGDDCSSLSLFPVFPCVTGVCMFEVDITYSSASWRVFYFHSNIFLYFSISGLVVWWYGVNLFSTLSLEITLNGSYKKLKLRLNFIYFNNLSASSSATLVLQMNGPIWVLILNCDFFFAQQNGLHFP